MSLRDDAEAIRAQVDNSALPAKYQRHAEILGGAGTAATGLVDDTLIGGDDDLLRMAGLDPDVWQVTPDKKHIWTKETANGIRRSIFFGFRARTTERDERASWLASKIERVLPVQGSDGFNDPAVVCLSDFQTGKSDKGGTHELVARFNSVLGTIAADLQENPPEKLVIGDVGDCVENHSSNTGTHQISTNDLTLDEQLRLWQRMLTTAIITLAPYAPETVITGVPSNHGAVRLDGKQVGDGDFGIAVLGAVRDAFDLIGTDLNLSFAIPDKGEIASLIPVGGGQVVFTHGHHAGKQQRIPEWVAGQAATAGSLFAQADVVVTGHYHSRAYLTSRGRELVQCPSMESASSWFRNSTGEWSTPGIATFRMRDGHTRDLRFVEP